MQNKISNTIFDIEPFSFLSEGKKKELMANLKEISLQPGEQLNDFDKLISGVIYIEKGVFRLLGLDDNNQMFTLDRFSKGEIFGVEQILRGVTGQVFAASTTAKGKLLPVEDLFKLIDEQPDFIDYFTDLNILELFSVLKAGNISIGNNTDKLKSWLKETCKNSKKVRLLKPGKHVLLKEEGEFLVSSCNIDGLLNGSKINFSTQINVMGKLPGRLIQLPENWPPLFAEDLSEKSNMVEIYQTDNELHSPSQYQLEFEALGDWFGKIHDDGLFPHFQGKGIIDETLACMRMLSRFYDIPFRKDLYRRVLEDQIDRVDLNKLKTPQLAAICDLMGLIASPLNPGSPELLSRAPFPAIVVIDGHPKVIWQEKSNELLISDPLKDQEKIICKEFFHQNDGDTFALLCVEKNANAPKTRFGLSWFIPSIRKYKSTLFQVVIASFFVQLLALFNPLLIQQIIDAAITQGNIKSLNVLGLLLVAMALSQALLSALRTYLFADTTNRIDISLGASIIHHLFRLPLSYFSRRPVGEISSRIGELENIRSFLTGTALTVFLDSVFSIIYIAVMLSYSVSLTLWALGVIPFFIGLTFGVAPIVRNQLRRQAEAKAKVQSHLVEILSGMETVKSQGMELPSEWRWEQFYGRQIQIGFQNTFTSTAASSTNQFLQQVSGLLVIWVGAILVLQGKMTLGQLIAFRILSGYVTNPLLRLATLWQNFQETALSLERLSDIVDHQEEIEIKGQNLPPMPTIKGKISYENVNFRFKPKGPLQLANVSFTIPKGSFVGVVGTSGSGKSTLIKLLTRLFDPIEGKINIDGMDISKFDLYSLRRQIGVVPQDSLLFDGSIQENIALAKAEASFDEIVEAAKISCAHDFIQSLPAGYSTLVGERGSGLSGGQRQRIAIARTIIKKPRLLILDEATSALDIDNEKNLIQNLLNAYSEITIIFITHRLSSLRNSDQILLMNDGVLAEMGSHVELMSQNGYYSTLYKQQELNT
tara:strand:+ start:1078 stop:4044 length:2967 start_codon:yes stop_codon:yes gene_type:complete